MSILNELRPGNLIELPSFNGTGENIVADLSYHVFAVNSTCIRDAEHHGDNWAGRAIPLSSKIFEENGIRDEDGYYYFRLDGSLRFYLVHDHIQITQGAYSPFMNLYHIKSVHMFQNVFYDLTGKELILQKI